ncbi:MAG: hypothetical protein E6248_06825 [Clostridium sp.]|uniref:hypothetical protein n=1 Tax=Clostridium sp. TaxID=1506 RepID=UPI0029090376|nr:hypothetical protein [Clostridium sp.]MDU5110144.1 hypothetical protein [Clostridium sp.]
MRPKKISIISSIIIILLIALIILLVSKILDKSSKEVKVAKDFIEELYNEDIINAESGFKTSIEEDALNKVNNKSSKIKYSVMVGSYAVDIDEDYKVLGFSNKNIPALVSENAPMITLEKAVSLSESYLSKLTKDEYLVKEVKIEGDSLSPIYNINFYKLKDGHPYYKQDINVVINNSTGKLEGYINYPIGEVKYINDINIDEKEARSILESNYKALGLDYKIQSNPMMYYITVSDNEMVLAYRFNYKVTNKDNKEEDSTSFIRADNGEVVNFNLEVTKLN